MLASIGRFILFSIVASMILAIGYILMVAYVFFVLFAMLWFYTL